MTVHLDTTQPPPHPPTLAEAHALIDLLWQVVGQLQTRVTELEEQLRLTSRNSSKPPSSDGPAVQRAGSAAGGSGRRRGGQPGHRGVQRALVPVEAVDQVYPCLPPAVCACGGEVRVAEHPCVRHQVFELPPIRPVVTEYQCYAGVCTCCGQRVVGELPAGVPRGQLGPGVVSLIGLLAGDYHLSVRQIQRLFHDVFHLDIGLGTVSYGQAQVSEAVAAVVETARQAVQQAAVVNVDETSHRQGTVRQWLWVAVSHPLSVFRISAQRNRAAAQALLGPQFGGILGSDRYSVYQWVDSSHRQLCWAHLLRDFQRIAERPGRAGEIGQELLTYGHWLFTIWHRYRQEQLPAEVFKALMGGLRKLVELALEEGARCDHAATAHTCQHLLDLKVALWTFVDTPGVEPTNNTAEQELRSHVIWRKLSFGTQSERGNRFIERIRTVTATCRRQGRAVWGYLREAVEAFFFGRPAPPLVTDPLA